MAKRGRPPAAPVKKWNPRYSKTAVRVALQNVFMSNPDMGMYINRNTFIKDILLQCDTWALKDGQSPPE
jgi:hypothetical protein